MDGFKRFVTLLTAGLLGAAAAYGYMGLTWGAAADDAAKHTSSSKDEWIAMAAAFEACVVFFGATYFLGRLMAGAIGARALADEIRRNGRWHLGILGGMSALLGFMRWYTLQKRGSTRMDDWVAIGVSVGFVIVTVSFILGQLRTERGGAP